MNRAEMFKLYEVSYFAEVDFIQNPALCTGRDFRHAFDEYTADPGASFADNIEQARRDVTATEARLRRSHADGLFDREAYEGATAKEKRTWVSCVSVVRGDYGRAQGELAHWRGYAKALQEGRLSMPAAPVTRRALAEKLAPGPDRSADPDGVPF